MVARVMKRVFDVMCAAAGLVITSPRWVLIPVLIRIDDRGPVFFRQARSGLRGREFLVAKFRSRV
ncbi:MAG: sugar transferase, partial [Acidobacteria bacterium]|nr:sugar transferase [Acidobacteriota bacterium]